MEDTIVNKPGDVAQGVPHYKDPKDKNGGAQGVPHETIQTASSSRYEGDMSVEPKPEVETTPENIWGFPLKISRSEKRYLKSLRREGVETSTVKLTERPPSPMLTVPPEKAEPIIPKWPNILATENPSTSTGTSTSGKAVKRIPEISEDTTAKRSRESNPARSFKAGIRVSIVPNRYPEVKMSEKEGNEIIKAFYKKTDLTEGPMPTFEGMRWMGDHLGYICTEIEGVEFLRELVQEIGKEYQVVESRNLTPNVKVTVTFPEKVTNEKIIKRLSKFNRGLDCSRWKVLRSKSEAKGFGVILAIDKKSKQFLEEKQNSLHYMCGKVIFRFMDEKEQQVAMQVENAPRATDESAAEEFVTR